MRLEDELKKILITDVTKFIITDRLIESKDYEKVLAEMDKKGWLDSKTRNKLIALLLEQLSDEKLDVLKKELDLKLQVLESMIKNKEEKLNNIDSRLKILEKSKLGKK
jgi:hypothetical protein